MVRASIVTRRGYTLLELMLVLALLAAIAGMSWPALMRPWSRSLAQQAAQDFASQVMDARLRAMEECRTYRVQWKPGSAEFEIASPAGEAEFSSEQSDAARSAIPDDPSALRDPDAVDVEDPNSPVAPTERREMEASRPPTRSGSLSNEPRPMPTRAPLRINSQLLHGVVFLDPQRLMESVNGDLSEDDAARDSNASQAEVAAGESDNEVLSASSDDQNVNRDDAISQWAPPVWLFPDGRTSNRRITLLAEDRRQIDLDLRGLTGTLRVGNVRNPRPITEDETGPDTPTE